MKKVKSLMNTVIGGYFDWLENLGREIEDEFKVTYSLKDFLNKEK